MMRDLFGWGFYLAIAVLGLASTAAGTVAAARWLSRREIPVWARVLLAILFATGCLLGLWIVLDLYWLARGALWLFGRARSVRC